MTSGKTWLAAGTTALALLCSACTTTTSTTFARSPAEAIGLGGKLSAETRRDIRNGVQDTLTRLDETVPGTRDIVSKAAGVLVFPQNFSAGFVVGGEIGNGELRVKDRFAGYYRTTTGSLGLQIGAQSRSLVILFMTEDALKRFRDSDGWSVGADASVAVMKVGANGLIDINAAQAPTVAFVMTNAGLMANLTLAGTKITPID